jgi:hypothetical protein
VRANDEVLIASVLNAGDRIRLVSPAGTSSEEGVHQIAGRAW